MELSAGFRNGLPRGASSSSSSAAAAAAAAFLSFLGDAALPLLDAADAAASSAFLRPKNFIADGKTGFLGQTLSGAMLCVVLLSVCCSLVRGAARSCACL